MHPAQYQPGQLLPGTVYRVIRHLATGGMGSVYEVEDTTVEKRYVLKTLHPKLVARDDLARRMRDEARSLAKLQHPNIVDVITAGVTSDAHKAPFYVMERLVGQNLRVVLEKAGALHVQHAYRIAIDVADALEHAHESNLVHRDVKPENIFLHRNTNGTTTTKLLDFGIVRLLDRKASQTHGKFIGTLRYASPEQVSGRDIGPATDLYSLGVVLFEMLAGRGPFDDIGDAYAIGAAHASLPAPPLSRFARVPLAVERLVASALSKDPKERPRDCFVFASELRQILREEEASPRSETAVNLLSSGSPPTHARALDASVAPSGATMKGMIPPSAVVSGELPLAYAPSAGGATAAFIASPALADGTVPVSPVASTLAAAEPPSCPPKVRAAPRPAAGAPPTPTAEPRRRAIDRDAPTRESGPVGRTQRLAQNDTQMVAESYVAVDAVMGARASAAPSASADDGRGLAFSSAPMHASNGTGPLAGEAPTRPPVERSPLLVAGGVAVLAIVMVGAAVVAVRKPWTDKGASEVAAQDPAAPMATASSVSAPSSPSFEPSPQVEAVTSAPSSSPPSDVAPGAPSPSGEDAPSGSAAQRRAATTTVKPTLAPPSPSPASPTTRGAAKPRPPAPRDIPFDP